ncbi:MAG: hypothetical protein ACLPZR_03250 [Solirubrobacteraceae bacterium]
MPPARAKRAPAKAPPDSRTEAAIARTITRLERDLQAATKRSEDARAKAEAADAQRDRVIRDAIASKLLPYARIVELTGLSEPRLYQIRRRARI